MEKEGKTVVCMGSFNPVTIGHIDLFEQILKIHPYFHLFVRYNEGVDLTSWEIKKSWFDRINQEHGNRIIIHKLTTDTMKGKQYNVDIFTYFIHLFEDELGTPIDEIWVGEDAAPLIEKAQVHFPNTHFVITARTEICSTDIRKDLEGHKDWVPDYIYKDLKTLNTK